MTGQPEKEKASGPNAASRGVTNHRHQKGEGIRQKESADAVTIGQLNMHPLIIILATGTLATITFAIGIAIGITGRHRAEIHKPRQPHHEMVELIHMPIPKRYGVNSRVKARNGYWHTQNGITYNHIPITGRTYAIREAKYHPNGQIGLRLIGVTAIYNGKTWEPLWSARGFDEQILHTANQ